MSFDLKHLPQTFADLVIANPLNAAVIKVLLRSTTRKTFIVGWPTRRRQNRSSARDSSKSFFACTGPLHALGTQRRKPRQKL